MDIILVVLGVVCLVVGVVGSILPVLPGPSAAWLSLLLLHWTDYADFSKGFLMATAVIALLTIGLDYVIPGWGTKRFGGSKTGARGALIGVFVGLFLGPVGVVTGPFVGALIGELLYDPRDVSRAFRAAWGSFIGFLAGTGIKLILSLVFTWYFVVALIS